MRDKEEEGKSGSWGELVKGYRIFLTLVLNVDIMYLNLLNALSTYVKSHILHYEPLQTNELTFKPSFRYLYAITEIFLCIYLCMSILPSCSTLNNIPRIAIFYQEVINSLLLMINSSISCNGEQ